MTFSVLLGISSISVPLGPTTFKVELYIRVLTTPFFLLTSYGVFRRWVLTINSEAECNVTFCKVFRLRFEVSPISSRIPTFLSWPNKYLSGLLIVCVVDPDNPPKSPYFLYSSYHILLGFTDLYKRFRVDNMNVDATNILPDRKKIGMIGCDSESFTDVTPLTKNHTPRPLLS